ncbi:MAG: carboxyl transferase domain-containing protein [bacterium]|nr:carboxyl transferase domain-containing protein [bacterium]
MSSTDTSMARERIVSLLDTNSFVEVGAMITKRSTDFNLLEKEVPADGVITGYGLIDNKPVYVYSQDSSSLNGTIGEMHAKKIASIYDLALKVGAPVVGLIDCAGIRLQEATDALAGFGDLYLKQTLASGVIPQITAVFGNCGGGVAVSSALSDFTVMEEKNAKLFVNSPNAIEHNYIAKCDTSSAAFQAEAGVVDVVAKDEQEVLAKVRELVSVLPTNNEDDAFIETTDDLNRTIVVSTDVKETLKDISDQNQFVEIKEAFAKGMVTGFLKLNGMTIGAVANSEAELSTDGCKKAADFVNFCDAFNIPVVTVTNVTGYKATKDEEKTIASAAAKLTYAFANATVPKINVIAGEAFGSAYITMNSKHIGADLVFAYPDSKIGMMDAANAVQIMYSNEIEKAADKKTFISEKAADYEAIQSSPVSAAKRGYIDNIIEPESTRKQLVYAFEMLFTKRESRPSKKHGTI